MERCYYDELQAAFDRRCRQKKTTNITISVMIVVLGVSSFLFGLRLEPMPTIFRWMTVDGTVFTTVGAFLFIVVMFSQLPFFAEHLPIFDRYDSFVMHVLIPILGVESFLINDSPVGKLSPAKRWHGTWFVTVYAVVILALIEIGRLPSEMIPYFFLDYRQNGWGIFLLAFAFVYGSAYLMAWRLSEWNRRLSWRWFKGITKAVQENLDG